MSIYLAIAIPDKISYADHARHCSCQGWRVWEGPGMEGVGGYSFSLQSNYFLGGIPGFHNLYINP